MNGHIFLLQPGSRTLVRMSEQAYESEILLQHLLANHPDLLAGDQIDPEEPRRWMLISQEMAVPDEEAGVGRWSLDHLFVDQDAIPTLVEVKRSCDTRIRREVVGQMLDYAANAVLYWPVETIRLRFERSCEARSTDPQTELEVFAGIQAEEFWQKVKTNLQAGKIRLVFLADEIPPELRRVVEFLNGQMDPAEVLAVEVKQYRGGDDLTTLVPRLVGQTALAQKRKTVPAQQSTKIDENKYLDEMAKRLEPDLCRIAPQIIQWSRSHAMALAFKLNGNSVSFIPSLESAVGTRYPFSVRSDGDVTIMMRWLRDSPPFDNEEARAQLRQKLNAIPGVGVPETRMTGYPSVPLTLLREPESLAAFFEAMDWLLTALR